MQFDLIRRLEVRKFFGQPVNKIPYMRYLCNNKNTENREEYASGSWRVLLPAAALFMKFVNIIRPSLNLCVIKRKRIQWTPSRIRMRGPGSL